MRKEDLTKLYYRQGKTLQEIGDKYGITRQGIWYWMIKFNLPRNTKRGNYKKNKMNGKEGKRNKVTQWWNNCKKFWMDKLKKH